ncbi:hypothetical protein C1646_757676 [Rhizophagus diaphanus]|nr:hypothetical protein C1646_757676 [Rhizophagus diaphanus] [Rhizophagus sp. MUCL 43196]
MVRHDVDSILAQRTQSASDKSDESDQHSVANLQVNQSLHMKALIPEVHCPIHLFLKMLRLVLSKFLIRLEGVILLTICACETVTHEIRQLTGKKIGGATIRSFYYGYSDSKYSTVKLISKWLDSKENISSLDNNTE